ncbi:hypothetical protein OUZ56_005229 [Daphnia magna]|uniref:Uncharacterized protein n=1 Tax=Daphnia magna TaxID=35525 RepID=A0ABQ9YS71_9CRUS|nr:hypothetical protein OUZ56_005229 [Daphnia magna]
MAPIRPTQMIALLNGNAAKSGARTLSVILAASRSLNTTRRVLTSAFISFYLDDGALKCHEASRALQSLLMFLTRQQSFLLPHHDAYQTTRTLTEPSGDDDGECYYKLRVPKELIEHLGGVDRRNHENQPKYGDRSRADRRSVKQRGKVIKPISQQRAQSTTKMHTGKSGNDNYLWRLS